MEDDLDNTQEKANPNSQINPQHLSNKKKSLIRLSNSKKKLQCKILLAILTMIEYLGQTLTAAQTSGSS